MTRSVLEDAFSYLISGQKHVASLSNSCRPQVFQNAEKRSIVTVPITANAISSTLLFLVTFPAPLLSPFPSTSPAPVLSGTTSLGGGSVILPPATPPTPISGSPNVCFATLRANHPPGGPTTFPGGEYWHTTYQFGSWALGNPGVVLDQLLCITKLAHLLETWSRVNFVGERVESRGAWEAAKVQVGGGGIRRDIYVRHSNLAHPTSFVSFQTSCVKCPVDSEKPGLLQL